MASSCMRIQCKSEIAPAEAQGAVAHMIQLQSQAQLLQEAESEELATRPDHPLKPLACVQSMHHWIACAPLVAPLQWPIDQ